MLNEHNGFPRVFLHTGDCYIGVQPTMVTTVLGSCVAVTMFSPQQGISAICHAFLPDSSKFSTRGTDPQPCRYVDTAVDAMLSSMSRLGADLDRLEVKIIGGASGLGGGPRGRGVFDMGVRNAEMAARVLEGRGVRVIDSHVGGNQGRKVVFLTNTGEIWIKRLVKLMSAETAVPSGLVCR
ncbi:MAG: chemotaxis protein CheD [Proteobacteria bacterium]|nr:chemotaxis protein CheD [Pseudomonadota bacterium]MBU1611327.1 chemotaxis protein CheD [Pseudomonadota bacterium]